MCYDETPGRRTASGVGLHGEHCRGPSAEDELCEYVPIHRCWSTTQDNEGNLVELFLLLLVEPSLPLRLLGTPVTIYHPDFPAVQRPVPRLHYQAQWQPPILTPIWRHVSQWGFRGVEALQGETAPEACGSDGRQGQGGMQ
jgi:hypothetical protein